MRVCGDGGVSRLDIFCRHRPSRHRLHMYVPRGGGGKLDCQILLSEFVGSSGDHAGRAQRESIAASSEICGS